MSATFQYRSIDRDLYFAGAWKNHVLTRFPDSNTPLVDSAIPGVFGGKYLDMTLSSQIQFIGLHNAPTSGSDWTLLFRTLPMQTGGPGAGVGLFEWGQPGADAVGGIAVHLNAAGFVDLYGVRIHSASSFINAQFDTAPSFTQDLPNDMWLTYKDSTRTYKLWQAQHGEVPVLIASMVGNVRDPFELGVIQTMTFWSPANAVGNRKFHIIEVVGFDSCENPPDYGARTDYLPTTDAAFEGYLNIHAAQNKIVLNEPYTDHGVSKLGTYEAPADEDVRFGVGTGLLVVPVETDVVRNVVYDSTDRVGFARLVPQADTRFGVPTMSADRQTAVSGTCHVPTAPQTEKDVLVDHTVGTLEVLNVNNEVTEALIDGPTLVATIYEDTDQ